VNGNGQSVASTPVVTTTPASTVPDPPTGLSLVRSGKNVTVSWTDPTDDGGSAITAYDVYESTTTPPSTSGTPKVAAPPTATSATAKKLSKTAKYYFVVLAVNANGKSLASSVVSTADKTTTTISCTPKTFTEASSTACTITVRDTTDPSTTPTGTVALASSKTGTFTGGPSCPLTNGSCSTTFTPSATGKVTLTASFPAGPQWLASNAKAKVKVKAG
jgi:hypothetical protein